jgi:hypothetical protein
MNHLRTRLLSALAAGALVAAGPAGGPLAAAQSAQPAPAATVADVRQMVADARKAIEVYASSAGAASGAAHPAMTWHATIWRVHERAPQSEAGAVAAVEGIRLLVRAQLWDRAHEAVASLDLNDRAWQRLPSVIYDEGIARKDFDYATATLSRTAASTATPSLRAAALIIIGRINRRQGDLAAATRVLVEARDAAPGTPQAEEADNLIYEIEHLTAGLPAPPVSGTPRNSRRPISLESFRGKPIVLVFWAST